MVIGVERQCAVTDQGRALAAHTHSLVLDGGALHRRTVQDEGIVGLGTGYLGGVGGAVGPRLTLTLDVDIAGGSGHRAVALHAACAVAGHGDVHHSLFAIDGQVAVAADARGLLDLALVAVPNGVTAVIQRQGSALDIHAALGLDALGASCAAVDGERAALDEHVAVQFGIGGVLGIYLDAIVTAALDVDGTAIHLEVLSDVDGVGYRTGDGDGAHGLLDLHILVAGQRVLLVARDGERAALAELGMALHEEGSLLGVVGTVLQRVGRSVGQLHGDALAVLDVDGCAVGVGQVNAVQDERHLVTARMVEAAARAGALQGVGVLGGHLGVLHDGHARPGHLGGDVVGDVTGHIDVGHIVVVLDEDIVVGKRLVGDGHAVHIGECKPFLKNSEQAGRTVRHGAHCLGVVGPVHIARVYPHGLLCIA